MKHFFITDKYLKEDFLALTRKSSFIQLLKRLGFICWMSVSRNHILWDEPVSVRLCVSEWVCVMKITQKYLTYFIHILNVCFVYQTLGYFRFWGCSDFSFTNGGHFQVFDFANDHPVKRLGRVESTPSQGIT